MAVCRSCGADLAAAARYCSRCGVRVATLAADERKVVTVLFADIAASTAMGAERDPEDARALIRPQLAVMRDELSRHGGTIEKYIGDAVMAVFGAPAAHEDDPERAVRAALAIRDALGEGVRIAVNTGEAVVALAAEPEAGEGFVAGDVVNTAFRIEEATPDGTVCVGEATRRATAETIEYGAGRLVSAKGKSEPLAIWEAISALGQPRGGFGPPLAPLVGRREELSLVLDTIARSKRDETVQLVTLVGAPGIGKSRVVWELQRALGDEPGLVTWLRGRCLPYGDGVTYWALGEMVKSKAGVLETDDHAAAEAKLSRAVRGVLPDAAEAAWVETQLRPLLALDATSADRREEAFAAWRTFFESLADVCPLVLAFEDLHWADEGLLDFIEHTADWSRDAPLLLLCTARPELLERRRDWGARPNAVTLALAPLTDDETAQLVSLLLRQSIPTELRETLVTRASGNPLYAEEFVRMLVDRGVLVRSGAGWALSPEELPVPESVQGIIASRLDALAADDKALLQAAAVVGRTFWPGAVAAVAGADLADVDRALHELDRRELLRTHRRSAVGGEQQYVFRHGLVRDVAYSQIPRARRTDTHLRAAEWVESLGRPSDHAETLAHHYLAALEYAAAAGQSASSFAERACTALRDAGDRALALNAPDAAARYFGAAIDLLVAEDAERTDLLFLRAKSLYRTGLPDERLLGEAHAGFLAMGDLERAAECEAILGDVRWRQGDRRAAFERLERAIAMLGGSPSFAKAYALANLARMRNAADEPEAAIALGGEAMAIADELGLKELNVAVLTTTGIARTLTGDEGGLDDLRRSAAAAEEINSPESVRAYYNLGAMHGTLGDLRASFAAYAEGRPLAERFGDAAWISWYRAESVFEHYWCGRWDEALALASELLDASGPTPASVEFDVSLVRAWIALARGHLDAASAHIEQAHAVAREAHDPQNMYPALVSRARVAVALGALDEALAHLDELGRRFAERPSLPSYWVLDLAFGARALGVGSAMLEPIRAAARPTRWLDAAQAITSGDLMRAARVCGEIGALPEEAYCRLAAAAREIDDGREPAGDAVGSALTFFRRVGASAYAREAEALLAAGQPLV